MIPLQALSWDYWIERAVQWQGESMTFDLDSEIPFVDEGKTLMVYSISVSHRNLGLYTKEAYFDCVVDTICGTHYLSVYHVDYSEEE